MSFSSKKPGGNFNIVASDAVEYVLKRFTGVKAVTTADVVEKAKKTQHAPDAFAALNILYVLSAEDRAAFHARLAAFDAGEWDWQYDDDVTTRRLDWLADEALKDLRAGHCTNR